MFSRGSTAARSRALGVALLTMVSAITAASSAGAKTPWPGGTWSLPAPDHGVYQVDNVSITMDDGVALVDDVSYSTDLSTGQAVSEVRDGIIEGVGFANASPHCESRSRSALVPGLRLIEQAGFLRASGRREGEESE